jgi:hypothetical protein
MALPLSAILYVRNQASQIRSLQNMPQTVGIYLFFVAKVTSENKNSFILKLANQTTILPFLFVAKVTSENKNYLYLKLVNQTTILPILEPNP